MKSIHGVSSLLLVLVAIDGTATAQATSKIVPAAAAATEGSTSSAYPFAYSAGRTQQIWRGTALTSTVGVLNGISYRRDVSSSSTAYNKVDYAAVTVSVGTSTVAPEAMQTTFASNITTPLTTVINNTKYSLPAQGVPTNTPAPHNIDVNWTASLVFDATKTNVMVEWVIPGLATKQNPYFVDAERFTGNSSGMVSPYGTFGTFSTPELAQFTAVASTLKPGGTLDITAQSFQKQYQARLILGVSDKTYNSISLPYDLSVIGAPNNSLYASMDLVLPFAMTQVGTVWQARVAAPIPNSPVFAGITAFAQSYYADAQANAAGLVASNGLRLVTAGGNAAPFTNTVGYHDSTQATGFHVFGASVQGGPVVQFKGVLP